MSATVRNIAELVNALAPFDTAEAWDNVGLLVGRQEAQVSAVLTALDVTPAVLCEAQTLGAQLIVTHHPLLFEKRVRITDADPEGALLLALCEAGVALVSAHTNLDKAAGGVNDALMQAVGFACPRGEGLLRTALLPESINVRALCQRVEAGLKTRVKVYGGGQGALRCLACCSGAGGDEVDAAIEAGADVLLTGEIKHHQALYAVAKGLCILEAGHYETERPAMETLAKALQSACDAVQYNVSVFCSQVNPFGVAGF